MCTLQKAQHWSTATASQLRAKPSLGLASTKPDLKELAAENLVSFTCKGNPDEVRTQKILCTCSTRRTQQTFFFPPHCLVFFWKKGYVLLAGTKGQKCTLTSKATQRVRGDTDQHQGLPFECGEANDFLVGNNIQLVKN